MKALTMVAAVAAGAVLLGGCGGTATGTSTGKTGRCSDYGKEHPVTALIVDVSGSTRSMRSADGPFERDWMLAACSTALHQGTLWATTADSHTVADSIWQIRDKRFKPTIEDNDLLGAAELQKQAEKLAPEAAKMIETRRHSASDLLGALQVAARLFRDYPDRPRELIFLTDGGISTGTMDLGYSPPRTEQGRAKVVGKLKHAGEIPDLTGGSGKPVRVWMGGLGHGLGGDDLAKARAVIDLWRAIIPAAGGELVSDDSSLRLTDFP